MLLLSINLGSSRNYLHLEKISDKKLCQAVESLEKGLIDTDLGSGVIKQRISRPNEGKSGGYRTIIFYHQGNRVFFVYGFAKNDQENINEDEEKAFKKSADVMLNISDEKLQKDIDAGILSEVECND
ncbi:MAG: hypothetical protein FD167_523 [bacterium]|nr:MAG: hypothetical protein FD167_523 [bacterium]